MFDQFSSTTMASTPPRSRPGKKHWWLTNRTIVYKYVKDARIRIATQEQSEIESALSLLDAALALSPRLEHALELKARSLLYLRRFKDVADMLHDYIPSLKMSADDSSSTVSSDGSSSQNLSRERMKLLPESSDQPSSFKCFSVSDLKKKVMAGLWKSCDTEGQWRYLVLGKACCHLGLMEDAVLLLQTGKRLATAAFRRESICWSEDSFPFSNFSKLPISSNETSIISNPPKTEAESVAILLSHIKLLLRRKTSAIAALNAGLYTEAIRHFSKIVDGRRGAPQGFLADCFMYRALAYRSAGRIAESIADCNRTLSLDPSCIEALSTRAALYETIRCLPDSLHDLEHLKLLYNSILRDRKLPGPSWKRQKVQYREIPGKLCSLSCKMQELKQRVASGEIGNVDYYALIGLKRGCSRSELERAHLPLQLRHKPDKSTSFIDRCEFADEGDVDSVRDRAKMSALLLYRMIQKGYTSVMTTIMDEESVERQRKKTAAALQAAAAAAQVQENQVTAATPVVAAVQFHSSSDQNQLEAEMLPEVSICNRIGNRTVATPAASVFQGVFCRDISVVGDLLSQVGFNNPIPVKYEALSC